MSYNVPNQQNRKEEVLKYVCFSSNSPSYKNCTIIGTPAKYGITHVAFIYQKDSPYQGIFDYYIKEMKEKGALKQIFSKYDRGNPVCPDQSGQALGFESCITAFLFLLSGKYSRCTNFWDTLNNLL